MAVRSAFAVQAEACESMGSPFTASLCRSLGRHLTDETAVGRFCLNWEGDPGPSADSIPLRICGGLHALVISDRNAELANFYPPHSPVAPSWDMIETALRKHEAFLLDWMQSPPQTNEVSRSAVVWPALMTVASQINMPLRLLEVGASGGLNLQMDRFSYSLGSKSSGQLHSLLHLKPEWRGAEPKQGQINITSRSACDLKPLDPANAIDALRLRSYCWPDQVDRLKRLDAALEIATDHPVKVEKKEAIKWLQDKLSDREEGICTVIYSTIAWQYLPVDARRTGKKLIEQAGQNSVSARSPLAWIRFEADGKSPGAGVRMQLWPQNLDLLLARADFHGRWVDWLEG